MNFALGLEIAKQEHGVGQIAHVEVARRIAAGDHAMLRDHDDSQDAFLIQLGEHLMHLEEQELLFRHRILIA